MTSIPTRNEVATNDTWDLSALFESEAAWNEAFDHLATAESRLSAYQGRLGESADTFFAFLEDYYRTDRDGDRLGHYAMLRQSEDADDSANQERFGRAVQLDAKLRAATSFFVPQLQQLDAKLVESYLADPRAEDYRVALSKLLRYREHTLSPSEERLLALQAEAEQTARRSFGALIDVDLDYGQVDTPEGPRPLSQSSLGSLLEHSDRTVRSTTFHQFYGHIEAHKNTLASLYAGSVASDIYRARVRKFGSAREAALFPDNVPAEVYDNLVRTVREHLPVLHRYYALRKQQLGLSDYSVFDGRVSLVENSRKVRPYDSAVDTVVSAVAPLGAEYAQTLGDGLRGRWVDRYENKGKRSGAFSAGGYDGPPYILMNYQEDSLNHVFTLAHEAGHSMHSWYSVRSNPYPHYDYTIFEAEVASTVNEQLLIDHLLQTDTDPTTRAAVINHHIDGILATLFRQTMFAEFEDQVHRHVESGGVASLDWLADSYAELLSAYFGDQVAIPDVLRFEGLRIPHFYRAFYVYTYATGVSASIALAQHILSDRPGARDNYLAFLKSGGSRFPIESLRVAGVDMTSPEPIEAAIALFARRVTELGELLES